MKKGLWATGLCILGLTLVSCLGLAGKLDHHALISQAVNSLVQEQIEPKPSILPKFSDLENLHLKPHGYLKTPIRGSTIGFALNNDKVLLVQKHDFHIQRYDLNTLHSQSITPPELKGRYLHSVVQLNNGLFLLTGYLKKSLTPFSVVFDPTTGKTRKTKPMYKKRIGYQTVLLENGKVVIAGGTKLSPGLSGFKSSRHSVRTIEMFDPRTLTYTPMKPRLTSQEINLAVPLKKGLVAFFPINWGGFRVKETQPPPKAYPLQLLDTRAQTISTHFIVPRDKRFDHLKREDRIDAPIIIENATLLNTGQVLLRVDKQLYVYTPKTQTIEKLPEEIRCEPDKVVPSIGARPIETQTVPLKGGQYLMVSGITSGGYMSISHWPSACDNLFVLDPQKKTVSSLGKIDIPIGSVVVPVGNRIFVFKETYAFELTNENSPGHPELEKTLGQKARNKALLEAIQMEDYENVKTLLEAGVDVNTEIKPNRVGRYSLRRSLRFINSALNTGNEDIILLLIQHGAQFDLESVFLQSFCLGQEKLFNYLIDKVEKAVLEKAALGSHLCQHPYSIHQRQFNGPSAQMWQSLFKRGVDIHVKDKKGNTPLLNAVKHGSHKRIQNLLQNGSDPAITNDGYPSLIVALLNRRYEAVETLLSAKTNFEIKDNRTREPDTRATYTTLDLSNLELAQSLGVPKDITPWQFTYPYQATALGWSAFLGPDIRHRHDNLKNKEDPAFTALLKAGANIYARDHFGRTPLMWAAAARNPRKVEAFIKAGTDVNAKDRYGNTAIHYVIAYQPGRIRNFGKECIALLSHHGADINAKNTVGVSPIMLDMTLDTNIVAQGLEIKKDLDKKKQRQTLLSSQRSSQTPCIRLKKLSKQEDAFQHWLYNSYKSKLEIVAKNSGVSLGNIRQKVTGVVKYVVKDKIPSGWEKSTEEMTPEELLLWQEMLPGKKVNILGNNVEQYAVSKVKPYPGGNFYVSKVGLIKKSGNLQLDMLVFSTMLQAPPLKLMPEKYNNQCFFIDFPMD
ncbi:MAG: ankyrin repeat domain-containing protein [Vampirovibrio sp.]|nr:ankyrin repeat domain-containing protein [Vampirovibrio sp.]